MEIAGSSDRKQEEYHDKANSRRRHRVGRFGFHYFGSRAADGEGLAHRLSDTFTLHMAHIQPGSA